MFRKTVLAPSEHGPKGSREADRIGMFQKPFADARKSRGISGDIIREIMGTSRELSRVSVQKQNQKNLITSDGYDDLKTGTLT